MYISISLHISPTSHSGQTQSLGRSAVISRHRVWYTAHTTYLTFRTDPVLRQVCSDIQTSRVVHSSHHLPHIPDRPSPWAGLQWYPDIGCGTREDTAHNTPPTSHSGQTQSLGRSAVISRHRVWYTRGHSSQHYTPPTSHSGQTQSLGRSAVISRHRVWYTRGHSSQHTTYLTFRTDPVLGQVCSDIKTPSVVHARTQLTTHHRPFFVTQPAKVVIPIVLKEKEIIINSW